MRSAISPLSIAMPRSLDAALMLLRDEPLVPIAGSTDLYVALTADFSRFPGCLTISILPERRRG